MVKAEVILLALMWAIPAHASLVERCRGFAAPGSATEADLGVCSNVQAGDLMYVGFEAGGSQTPNTPTDSIGNAFTVITGGNQTNGVGQALYHYSKVAVAGDAGATIKCTVGVAAFIECNLRVFYNTDGTGPQLGATNFSTGPSSTTYTFANTNAPTKSGSVILFSAYDNGGIPSGGSNGFSSGPIDTTTGSANGTATGFIGDSSTTAWTAPTLTGSTGLWMGGDIEIQTSNGSNAGAVGVCVGAVNAGVGQFTGTTPCPQTQNGDEEFALFSVNSTTPNIGAPAGWTCPVAVTNSTANPNASSLTVCTHTKAGGDGASWNFTNANTNSNIGAIISMGNLNTTTPIDVNTSLVINQYNNVPMPSINPKPSDDLILRAAAISGTTTFDGCSAITFSTAGMVPMITFPQSNGELMVGFNDLSLNGANYVGPTGNCNHNSSDSLSLALQSAATPSRTTGKQRVTQEGLIMMVPLQAGCAGCGGGMPAP